MEDMYVTYEVYEDGDDPLKVSEVDYIKDYDI